MNTPTSRGLCLDSQPNPSSSSLSASRHAQNYRTPEGGRTDGLLAAPVPEAARSPTRRNHPGQRLDRPDPGLPVPRKRRRTLSALPVQDLAEPRQGTVQRHGRRSARGRSSKSDRPKGHFVLDWQLLRLSEPTDRVPRGRHKSGDADGTDGGPAGTTGTKLPTGGRGCGQWRSGDSVCRVRHLYGRNGEEIFC